MKKSVIIALLMVTLLIVMQVPAKAGEVLLYEGFETPPHTVGAPPEGWSSSHNNAQQITDSRSYAGDNSCRFAAAPYWAGSRYKGLVLPTDGLISFSVYMQQSSESTTTYDNSNLESQLRGEDWLAQIAFRPIFGSGSTQPYLRLGPCPDLADSYPIVLDQWYHMEVLINPATRTADFFMDGTLVCENADITYDLSGNITNSVHFGAGNIDDGSIVGYWDEIKVETVDTVVEVNVDIKPQSCPNPLNVKSKGVLPVAILGTEILDVTTIDPLTITLAGVSPLRSAYEDVATPVAADADECDCTTEGPDGFTDLTLKFDRQAIVAAIGEVNDGDVVILTLEGLVDGDLPVIGSDCVWILKKGK